MAHPITEVLYIYPGAPALALAAPNDTDGVQHQRFRKDLIKVGSFVKASDGMSFAVNSDSLHHWAQTFSQMKANGIRVPVPHTHTKNPESISPEDNRGWLEDVFVDGDTLVGVIDLVGEDGIALAGRSDVSIYVPPVLIDGHGNTYKRPITHVALCTDPVIPGLGEFKAIAASLKENKKMDWTKIAKALGIEEAPAEDKAEEVILSHVTKLGEDHGKQVKELQDKVAVLEAQLKEKGGIKEVDPVLLSMAAENRTLKLNTLVEAGNITPAVRDKLQDYLIGADSKALHLALSRGDNSFDKLVEILRENKAVDLQPVSGPQTLSLNHPGAPAVSPLVADAERRAAAAKH